MQDTFDHADILKTVTGREERLYHVLYLKENIQNIIYLTLSNYLTYIYAALNYEVHTQWILDQDCPSNLVIMLLLGNNWYKSNKGVERTVVNDDTSEVDVWAVY